MKTASLAAVLAFLWAGQAQAQSIEPEHGWCPWGGKLSDAADCIRQEPSGQTNSEGDPVWSLYNGCDHGVLIHYCSSSRLFQDAGNPCPNPPRPTNRREMIANSWESHFHGPFTWWAARCEGQTPLGER